MMGGRDKNLDLIRAIAIVSVVAYHIDGMWPERLQSLHFFLGLGKYGVVLFFVLSGWLIGGIYFRELAALGSVNLRRFWAKRWLRTIPPYVCGVILGFGAVKLFRNEPFDFAYLFFAQNYRDEMPYYLVSWSICVEEHFYLALPIIGLWLAKLSARFRLTALWGACLIFPLLRLIDPNVNPNSPFGYSHTASHLVSEGLAIGVAAAYSKLAFPVFWPNVRRVARGLLLPSSVGFISIAYWDDLTVFYFGQTFVAVVCFLVLASVEGTPPFRISSSRFVGFIAATSYSIYLTHSLSIHLAMHASRLSTVAVPGWLLLIAILTIMLTTSTTFYFFVERFSLKMRDRFFNS